MSRYAILYDIHGNLPALEAVLAEVRAEGFDEIIVGGDVVPGPMPCESLDTLLAVELPTRCITGNGERVVLALTNGIEPDEVPPPYREGIRWSAGQLEPRHVAALSAWPAQLVIEIPPFGTVLFCHATPRNDTEIFTRRTDSKRLDSIFAGSNADIVVCGHTHMQFDRVVGRTRVVNAGSVGMPFGAPGAYWLELGVEIRLRHTAYDLAAAAERITRTSFPSRDEFARHNVLEPPSEAQMLDAFAKAELH